VSASAARVERHHAFDSVRFDRNQLRARRKSRRNRPRL